MEQSAILDFLFWLELTSVGTFVRESPSLLAYPSTLFMHTMGLGLLVGVNAIVDLRLLGVASSIPVRPLRGLFKFMWLGFWFAAVSGLLLLVADASTKLINPVFYIKLSLIGGGVAIVMLLDRKVFRKDDFDFDHIPSRVKWMAGISLILWVGATTAGRLMAYVGPVSGLYF